MSEPRPKQIVPEELIGSLMSLVRGQFCGDMTAKEWAQHSHFVRRNVVLWPAHFVFNVKGFTLPGQRYEQILRGIFSEIKQMGHTDVVKFWPGYLMKCVQEHFEHHWEEYYAEAKSVRNMAMHTLATLGSKPAEDKTVEALALAHRALTRKVKPVVFKPASKAQLSLFK